jgi:selenium donor protein
MYTLWAEPRSWHSPLSGMPIKVLAPEVIREILRGGEAVCTQAEIPLAGGHSIDSVEPIYGLVALGTVHPDQVKRNSAARAGDVLILGKPLGIGILSAALKKEQLDPDGYRAMIELTTRLNRAGPDLARVPGVHAMTDVTGFGLLGHLLEMCGSSCATPAVVDRAAGEVSFPAPYRTPSSDTAHHQATARSWVSLQRVATRAAHISDTHRYP